MRQLAYSYSFPTGFVQKYPEELNSNLNSTYPVINNGSLPNLGGGLSGNSTGGGIIFYGLTLNLIPSQGDFAGLKFLSAKNWNEQFVYGVTNNSYLLIAAPTSLGTPGSLTFNGFNVTFVKNTALVTTVGDPIEYTIYRSQYQQNGVNIILTATI